MKITILGSSHGVPSAERFCSCYLLECGGARYLIDAGAPIFDALLRNGYRRADFTPIRALFTTHGHGDHVAGLLHFANLINWYYKSMSVKIFMTEQVLVDGFRAALEAIALRPLDPRLDFRVWDGEGVGYEDENIRVTLIPNAHQAANGRPSYSLLIEGEGKSVVFTGDLSQGMKHNDFPNCDGADLVISEMAHFGFEHIDGILKTCTAKRIVFSHVAPIDKLEEIETRKNDYPVPLAAAFDGMIIEI